MKSIFYQQLERSTAHRKCRDDLMFLALGNSVFLEELFEVALNINDKNHYKACWVLELVLMEKLELIEPHLDIFLTILSNYSHHGALRSISKIVMMLSRSKNIELEKKQKEILIENCFLWLSLSPKVATKAYAAYALRNFGKENQEILPLLYEILEQDYSKFTAAYKAMARDVMKGKDF